MAAQSAEPAFGEFALVVSDAVRSVTIPGSTLNVHPGDSGRLELSLWTRWQVLK